MSKKCLFFIVTAVPFFVPSSEINVKINGLSGELEQNVNARMAITTVSDLSENLRVRNYLRNEVEKGLKAVGYYSPKITFKDDNSSNTINITVEPGKPVMVKEVNVVIKGDGASDEDYINIEKSAQENVGKELKHNNMNPSKHNSTIFLCKKATLMLMSKRVN